MKFDCDKKWGWHRWFAWYPVRIANNDCRWLEVVERKKSYREISYYSFSHWEYRAP